MAVKIDHRFIVINCPACGDLHPVYFDERAGIDGDAVYDCQVAGRQSTTTGDSFREVVSCAQEEP